MTTRALLKNEIDALPDDYIQMLYNIIRAFVATSQETPSDWQAFVQTTYGCLADTPIERGPQGDYELRATIR